MSSLEPEAAAAQLQCRNSINKMMQCLDVGDSEGFALLFTTDGVISIARANAVRKGREEIARLCDHLHATFKGCTHWEGNAVMEHHPDRQTITNRSYWRALRGWSMCL